MTMESPVWDPHRIEVFHRADGDDVACAVPHHLELDFLPARDALFHQDLMDGGHPQAVAGDLPQFILVPGDAAAASPQGEGGPHDDRVANLMGEFQGGLQVGHHQGGDDRLADPLHRVLEKLAVLRLVDGIGIGSQQPDAVFREESLFRELHGQGQPGLSAQGGQQAVRLLLPDDPLDRLQGQGFDVDLIRHGAVGHDGGGVGV